MSVRRASPRAGMLLFASLCLIGSAAADPLTQLSESLIRLRGEVEQLNQELEISRDEGRVQLASLNAQQAELQGNLQRQELTRRELEEKLGQAQERAQQAGVAGETLKPVLLELIDQLAAAIRAGLPFRIEDRLAELAEFRAQIDSGAALPHRAANRLWAFFEDELRLTRENGIYSQTISVGGERLLVDVAKLGTVMMFFRTQDARVGQARRDAGGWRFEFLTDAGDRRRVLDLFDALRKQIRQGYFELPNALQLSGGAQ